MAGPPLSVTIGGFATDVAKEPDGSVTVTVHVGFPVGDQVLTIPAAEWQQIVAYVAGQP